MKKTSVNMTQGNINRQLLGFAIPTILGNLFQLTYNAADSIIIGRFAGKEALAAVGTANPLMNIILFFIIGICLGASVLMSEFYGAGDIDKLKKEISTAMLCGGVFTFIVSAVFIVMAKPMLILMRTPQAIVASAASYLHIILLGLIFTFLYNIFAAALKSIGDSRTPIVFLALASVLNVCLDIIFIKLCGWGVRGAALATVIAEAVSGLLCVVYVYKNITVIQINRNQWHIDKQLLKSTLSYSWASAMQQTCLYVGKVLVQAAVNPLGVDSIATFNAVNRIDDFAFTPQQSIGHSITVFTAQNRGAKNTPRMTKGFAKGMRMETIYGIFIGIVIFAAADPLMGIFVAKEGAQVVALGVSYLRLMAFFYILPAFTNGIQGYFRGMGQMQTTLICTTIQIIGRVVCAYPLAAYMGLTGIAYSCGAGWIFMLLYEVPILIKLLRQQKAEQLQ
ncbi:MAG: MATE family efflux transporter [Oscillospiraceae bacterium]|nr:MATE family efflux transporter [Oscillospiraceae bacterium]